MNTLLIVVGVVLVLVWVANLASSLYLIKASRSLDDERKSELRKISKELEGKGAALRLLAPDKKDDQNNDK